MPTKITASCCGLAGFAISIVAGMSAENPGDVILERAIVAMFVCNFLGWIIGTVVERTLNESLAADKKAHPIPETPNKNLAKHAPKPKHAAEPALEV